MDDINGPDGNELARRGVLLERAEALIALVEFLRAGTGSSVALFADNSVLVQGDWTRGNVVQYAGGTLTENLKAAQAARIKYEMGQAQGGVH